MAPPPATPCTTMADVHALAARAAAHGPLPLAVAGSAEEHVMAAVARAFAAGYVTPHLFGDAPATAAMAEAHGLDPAPLPIVDVPDAAEAGRAAVAAVADGRCALLMKGYVQTAVLMRSVLDRERGLRGPGKMSHVLVIDLPDVDRLLFMSDGALNIEPDLPLKIEIVKNAVAVARRLGVEVPKVALLAAIETVDVAQRSSVDTAIIAKMADRGQIRGALVDGPLALDNAIDPHAAEVKRIASPVAGRADVIVVDNIDVGNVLYKALVYFAHAAVAGAIVGASAPLVLTSRADSSDTKFDSIALGVALAAPAEP